jgi:hypothetical protein
MPCPCSLQFLLGKPTVMLGAVSSGLGAAVGLGGLAFLAENPVGTSGGGNLYSMMIIANSLSLTTFSVMLLVAFSCPNEKYANFFGFLQFAAGKATLMSFSGIIELSFGILFAYLPEKAWVGVLIFCCAGLMYTAVIMVVLRSCCYENNQAIIMQAAASAVVSRQVKNSRSAAKTGASRQPSRSSGSEFGNGGGRAKDYEAPPVQDAPAQAQVSEDAFGADNPFS